MDTDTRIRLKGWGIKGDFPSPALLPVFSLTLHSVGNTELGKMYSAHYLSTNGSLCTV